MNLRCTWYIYVDMFQSRDENFLATPPCPFRHVSFGTAHCTISTDSHVSEVDPLVCHNCEVPGIISEPRCRFLSLGTELKPYRGQGKLVTSMACRELNIKIYNLEKTCGVCPLYSETSNLVDAIKTIKQTADIQIPVREELVEQIAGDIKLEYGVREEEAPPLREIRCWRFPEGKCRKLPVYTPGKITVVLRESPRNDEIFKRAVLPAIKEMNLIAYRIDEEIETVEEECRICENIQESDYLLASLDDWSTNLYFLSGIALGRGISSILIKNENTSDVPLTSSLQHQIVYYKDIHNLQQLLLDQLALYIKPSRENED